MLVWIGYADDVSEAQRAFSNLFGPFFARHCTAEEGVIENGVTCHLVPSETIALLRRALGEAQIEFYPQGHLNAA